MAGQRAKRPVKRTLVRWNDDLDIQILLTVQKVCNTKGLKVPWDDVGAELTEANAGSANSSTGSTNVITGSAIIQHLTKVRNRRINLGLPVPGPLKRGGGPFPTAKKRREARKSGDDEANEDESPDVDDISDPEASFDEGRRKRVKRESSDTGNDAQYESKPDTKALPQHNLVKVRGKFAATKKIPKKVPKDKSSGNNLMRDPSLESPSVGAAERARRRSNVNYAELNDADELEVMTDIDEHDPHVAVGSSLLKLTWMKNEEADENKNAAADDNASSLDGEEDHNEGSLVTVLKYGKKSQSTFSDVERLSSQPVGFGRNSLGNTESHALRLSMAGNNLGTNLFPYSNDTNFVIGAHAPIIGQPTVDHYRGLSGPQLSEYMRNFMPPTPITATGFDGFPGGEFGTNTPPAYGMLYESPYGVGFSQPASVAPRALASDQTFHGYYGYPQGLNMDHTQLPQHSPSANNVGEMGSNTDLFDNDNDHRNPDTDTASTNPEPGHGMLSFGNGNENVFLTEPDQFDPLY